VVEVVGLAIEVVVVEVVDLVTEVVVVVLVMVVLAIVVAEAMIEVVVDMVPLGACLKTVVLLPLKVKNHLLSYAFLSPLFSLVCLIAASCYIFYMHRLSYHISLHDIVVNVYGVMQSNRCSDAQNNSK
jgi:hypothetical protein